MVKYDDFVLDKQIPYSISLKEPSRIYIFISEPIPFF